MARVSKKEMEQSTTHIRKDTKSKIKECIIYDKAGNIQEILPDDQIMAATYITGKNKFYKVRVNLNNDLYEPNNKDYIAESFRLSRISGQSPHFLTEVPEESFKAYVQFLRTGNILNLEIAKRGF